MATIDVDYVTIAATMGGTVGDTASDQDTDPDWITADSGFVTFTPTVKWVHAYNSNSLLVAMYPFPIKCTINSSGQIEYNDDQKVSIVDLGTSKVTPAIRRTKAAYIVSFDDVKLNNQTVGIGSFGINPAASDAGQNGIINLWDLQSVPRGGNGPALARGPRGYGVPDTAGATKGDTMVWDGTDIVWEPNVVVTDNGDGTATMDW